MSNVVQGHAEPDPTVYVPPSRTDVQPQGGIADPWKGAATSDDPVPGGGYAFTPDQLRSIADKWEALGRRFRENKLLAQTLATTEGAGVEYASLNNAEKVQQSGHALLDALDQRIQYCDSMSQKFRDALGTYSNREHETSAEMKQKQGKF
ncbi:hypothetical protein ABZ639_23260 [Saccharomonospora sp. NPDC006951]